MNLNKLTKNELINLKNDIDVELKKNITKEIKPDKDSILALKNGDKIFGIRLSFGPHKLKCPEELDGEIDIIDYCVVENNDLRGDEDTFRISIFHPDQEVAFGIITTLTKEKYINEHCMLFTDTFKSGYDGFYTLKPKTWKKDLKRLYQEFLEDREKRYQDELGIYEKKLNMFLEGEKKINQYI